MGSDPVRAGIVGAGNMGGRMGRRVAAAGDPIVAYDRDARTLADCGMEPAASLGALVEAVDVVLLSLPDSSVIEPVVLGDDGVLAHARAGQVVVDLSTAAPESTVRLHAALAERGVQLLDAGISGGAKAAEQGSLTIMAGGDAIALERVRPLLERFSAKVVHMGGPGTGHVAKVLNNFLNGIALAATAEVMVAGRKAGLDLERLLDVFNSSSGVNFATLNRFPSIVRGDYLEGGLTGRLMAKDVRLYLEHVAHANVPTFTGPGCLAAFELTNAMGYGDKISNRIVDGIGDLAGGVRLHDEREAA
ncbi:NAD(P)-dependent oxidoreductase [Conexibacter sp. CPCC 206217]|uniref:NAD(P)-dependent oxidoreductase n=1 Tax=Conexibacter sp. CPCC 206217 TaxID=3064574 RepID=UPI00272686FC|nr:NAD(P)-dependent oxidoreductase [Conexibacter sp. CPCC 206217]MDO8212245.1 NAD(P)-dependent oxidoreductase [Conexibacter sp. CPCC 206217]